MYGYSELDTQDQQHLYQQPPPVYVYQEQDLLIAPPPPYQQPQVYTSQPTMTQYPQNYFEMPL